MDAPDRAETIRRIAAVLAAAYLRLRQAEFAHHQLDSSETPSESCDSRLTL
jgi:hypothetical protein